jgi:hypothetical protein
MSRPSCGKALQHEHQTRQYRQSTPAVPASAVRGGGLMSLAMLGFVLNDTIAKTLAGTMNVGQFIAIRGAVRQHRSLRLLVVMMGKWQRTFPSR